jgi:hypothetical protein
MGISFGAIAKMKGRGLFGSGNIAVLDVGASNLYSASSREVLKFLVDHGQEVTSPEMTSFAERMEVGSRYDSTSGGSNGAFVGELFEKAGFRYTSIDIADGYRTKILDLNHQHAPKEFIGAFDLVLNFGTTEHLLNQYNAFKVIHDSTRVGGYIVHSLPCAGYSNHGYFTYTPRCMFDIAGYNEYELIAFWFEGPSGNNDLYSPVRDYSSYFPSLEETLTTYADTDDGKRIAELAIPDVGLVVVYRKVKGREFLGALERSTSVGRVPSAVTEGYGSAVSRIENAIRRVPENKIISWTTSLFDRKRWLSASSDPKIDPHVELSLKGEAEQLRGRFIKKRLSLEESLKFYELVVEECSYFPHDWEILILKQVLLKDPSRDDVRSRLSLLQSEI